MRKRKAVGSLISPPPSSKINNSGGREKREGYNRDLILQGVYDLQLEWILMKRFKMEAKDEQGEGFRDKGESFWGQRKKKWHKMMKESTSCNTLINPYYA